MTSLHPRRNLPSTLDDPDTSLLASPSKSRAAAIAAKNWSTVTTWLTQLFAPSPVPAFERNEATLAYLLSLVHTNDAANSERELLHRAKLEALSEVETTKSQLNQKSNPPLALLHDLSTSLSQQGTSALDSIATTAILLGALPPHSAASLATSLSTLTHSTMAATQHVQRLADINTQLLTTAAQTQSSLSALSTITSDDASTTALRSETAQWTRETKQLSLKTAEYADRIASLERWNDTLSDPLFSDIKSLEEGIDVRQREVKGLEERVREYHGLPADVEVSRAEIRRAQGELAGLKGRREELFGRMVE